MKDFKPTHVTNRRIYDALGGIPEGTFLECTHIHTESGYGTNLELMGYVDFKPVYLTLSKQSAKICLREIKKESNVETDMILSTDSAERKNTPITTGVLDYFPLAIAEVAKCSKAGNDQHNPNQPLHWDKSKSTDHSDCIGRHLIDRGRFDTDGIRHSAKLAWRALALLQIELENEQQKGV